MYVILVGADIKEMKDNSYATNLKQNFIAHWNGVAKSRKPLIAAVNGYAVSNAFGSLRQSIVLKRKKNSKNRSITYFCFIVGRRE